MPGPAKSTQVIFEALDEQFRQQHKPRVWFLPLNKPIAPAGWPRLAALSLPGGGRRERLSCRLGFIEPIQALEVSDHQ